MGAQDVEMGEQTIDGTAAADEHVVHVSSEAQILDPVLPSAQVTVAVNNLSAWVPAFFAPPSTLSSLKNFVASDTVKKCLRKRGTKDGASKSKGKEQSSGPPLRQVLFNLSVSCAPGEVLALMGPSGGGKTSMLTVIGGRTPAAMKTEGSVVYNGKGLTKEAKRKVGFVLQDDLLHESLTVWETLYFAAMLRLPKHMSKQEKKDRVGVVVAALGLGKCTDTIIGGFFRRGVSGGERKRVSVGHELLINPSVILLDEPTSGLDSTTAMKLLQTLRDLAQGGRAIVTTIHQPSSRLYQQLDSLLLLSQGHAMYYGAASKAIDWFNDLNCQVPYGVNVADFILDCASGECSLPKLTGEESRVSLIKSAEDYLQRNIQGFHGDKQESSSAGFSDRSSEDCLPTASNAVEEVVETDKHSKLRSWFTPKDRWGASYFLQLQVLFLRAIKVRRFESMSIQDLLQFVIVGAVTGCIWWQRGDGQTLAAAQDVAGILFFEGLFLAFRIMFSALFTFPSEFKMMLKERASGMYRLSAFYFARTASDLPMDWTIPTLFVIIIYWMAWLRPTAGAFFANWAAVMLLQMVAQSFGLIIGASVMVPKTAQTIAAVIMLTFMLIGGYYARSVPAWIDWLKYVSFMNYGFTLLCKIEFSGQTYYDCGDYTNKPADPANDPSCVALSSEQFQQKMGFSVDINDWAWEAVVLLGYLLLLRVGVYVVLRRKTGKV